MDKIKKNIPFFLFECNDTFLQQPTLVKIVKFPALNVKILFTVYLHNAAFRQACGSGSEGFGRIRIVKKVGAGCGPYTRITFFS